MTCNLIENGIVRFDDIIDVIEGHGVFSQKALKRCGTIVLINYFIAMPRVGSTLLAVKQRAYTVGASGIFDN